MALNTGQRLLSTGNKKDHPINKMLTASNAAAMWQSSQTAVQLHCNCSLYRLKTENPKFMQYKIIL